jgi:hypothetical protein
MNRGEEQQLHIRGIRDAALSVVVKLGKPIVVEKMVGRPLEASIEGFSIFHITPFQKTPEPSQHVKYAAAKHGITWRPPPPYLVDIRLVPGRKVFSVAWGPNEEFETICFKRGRWESNFLSLTKSISEQIG